MDNLDQRQSTIISPEKKPLPVLKDPKLYLANFFNSKEYRDAIDKFFEGKNPNPQVTEEQKAASFLNYGDIETPLYNFYENNMRIAYDGSFYTPEITRLWSEYTTQIRKLKQNRYDKEEMMAHNDVRSAIHTETANLLVQEEIAPNAKVWEKTTSIHDYFSRP